MAKRLRPLTGLDALFVYLEAMGTPMHVASLIRLRPPSRGRVRFANALRQHLLARLADVSILRRELVAAPLALGHPMWREVADFDPAPHIRVQTFAKPGSERQLHGLIARLHAVELDRSRPLWEIVVVDGLADGSVALYLKSHHALVDGQAGVQVTGALLDVEPRPLQRPVSKAKASSDVPPQAAPNAIARAALRASAKQFGAMLRGVPEGVRRLAAGARESGSLEKLRDSVWLAPRTPFNSQLDSSRRFAATKLPLPEIKRVAKHFGASLNDVVMALCAGALRAHLLKSGELPDEPLIAAMPVSLRAPGVEGGNEVSMVQCPLATDIADPVERLAAITSATRQIKGRVASFKGLIPTDFPGMAAPIWATGVSRLWQRGRLSERLPPLANLVISNVPGPPVPLFVAGAAVTHFQPVSIITHGLGLNITVLSYAGSLEVGIVASQSTLDKPEALTKGLQAALAALTKAALAMPAAIKETA
ncbi:MAG: wax ester/triacylglycerol synthase family O-acyltransferase [Pseudomarimonas sp.]